MQMEEKKDQSGDDRICLRDVKSTELNNNHHVVPLGILVVLCTVYLMIAGVQNNYNYYFKSGVAAEKLNSLNVNKHLKDVGNQVLEQPMCRKIDVFAKEIISAKTSNESTGQAISIKRRKQLKTHRTAGRHSKLEGQRKRDNAKKSNTAEPIIYMLALVFIYLLLKAASDINQHYKTQSKADKRLRRCSLQSYAQKEQRLNQDRRASKDIPLQTRHTNFAEARSLSLDRYRPREPQLKYQRQQSSVGDQTRSYPFKPMHPAIGKHLAGEMHMEPHMSRRLSVPISINYQMVQVSPLMPFEQARRGSVTDISNPPALSVQTPDSKRRVRMINRH